MEALLMTKKTNFFRQTYIQVKWWKYAAWTLPFAALAIIFFASKIGFSTYQHQITSIVGIVFVSVSVFWWWWAIDKILVLYSINQKVYSKLTVIKNELTKTRNLLKNDSDR